MFNIVIYVPDALIGKTIHSISLQHPRTREETLFMECEDSVFEVVKFTPKLGCLFIDDKISQDASFKTITPVDPLLLTLEIFRSNNTQFRSLNDILSKDNDLLRFCSKQESLISLINDVRDVDEDKYYRYNSKKAMEWLSGKVTKVIEVLKKKDIKASTKSSGIKGLTSSAQDASSDEDLRRYAVGLLRQYLSRDVEKQLFEHLGLNEMETPQPSISTNTNKPVTSSSGPKEDYFVQNLAKSSAMTAASNKNLTRAQKDLLKVDKSGMKSLSSYFTKKK